MMRCIRTFLVLLIASSLLLMQYSCEYVTTAHARTLSDEMEIPERPLPSVIVKGDNNGDSTCVRMTNLTITAEVNGRIASTTYDMIFESSCDRTLEGELEFPLGDGQTVSGYALDVDGKLREGVVVDKTKARKTFETIVRRGADPGLVEKTKGNNFKTRIYPLSKNHPRHVRITYNQEIRVAGGNWVYMLPLYSNDKLDHFSLDVKVVKPEARPVVESSFRKIQTESVKESELISLDLKDVVLRDFLKVQLPVGKERNVWTKRGENETYFYLTPEVPAPMVKEKPKSIAVIFDVSSSAENRDVMREMSLLNKYMEYLGRVDVCVVTFSNKVHTSQLIPNASFEDVKKIVLSQTIDGGTQMGVLKLSECKEDEILLFSDGISNFGVKNPSAPNVPLYAIHSSLVSDFSFLKNLSKWKGDCINLNEMTEKEALKRLTHRYSRLKKVECKGAKTERIYPGPGSLADENLSLCGKMIGKKGRVVVTYVRPDGTEVVKEYDIDETEEVVALDKIWAQKKLAALETDSVRDKEHIKSHALKYGLVSDYTSLIVLERVEDYIMYEIDPPAELREEYERLRNNPHPPVAIAVMEDAEDIESVQDETLAVPDPPELTPPPAPLLDRMMFVSSETDEVSNEEGQENSWEDENEDIFSRVPKKASFPGGTGALMNYLQANIHYPEEARTAGEQGRVVVHFCVEIDGRVTNPVVVRGVSPALDEEALRVVRGMPNWTPGESDGQRVRSHFYLPVLFRLDGQTVSDSLELQNVEPPVVRQNQRQNQQQIQRRNYHRLTIDKLIDARQSEPDYMKEIKKVSKQDAYTTYLLMRKSHNEVVFFLDMADYFRSIGQKEVALRILSNIAELKLEDSEVLRSLGGKLMEYGEYELAVEAYKDVVNMREEEPQSYRDLALAYDAVGNYKEAFSLLDTVTFGEWSRFKEIKDVSKYEERELMTRHPELVSVNSRKLPMSEKADLRVVISWNTDNTDMDLWVVDPNDDACGYNHKVTSIGGWISQDFIRGYGPEAFMLPKAIPGKYKVYLNYYGTTSQRKLQPVIVRVTIYQNYGKKNQTCEDRMVTLDTVKGWILLDEIEVK